MRDGFWYKIEDYYRYDLTEFGHENGTGVVTFNSRRLFPKYDLSNWTLVTAYFNLTKFFDATKEIHARDKNYYLNHAVSTLNLPHNLVIYCDQESLEQIKSIRPKYLWDKTVFKVIDFDSIRFKKNGNYLEDDFQYYRSKILINRIIHPSRDPRNTPSYYLFCMSRYTILKEVIESNPFGSTHYAWINFCIERMGYKNLVHLDEALDVHRDKFSTCYIDYIPPEHVLKPSFSQISGCSMCSGFFTGNKEYMYKVCDLIEDKFLFFMKEGYGHADEQLYSPVYFENPDLFEHYYGDYQQMITNYKYIYEAPDEPITHFIRNSFENQYPNHLKCYEACLFVFRSWVLGKCEISQNSIYHLFYFMNFCKKILKILE